ncbi:hypothetical protein BDR04DRAFT_971686, partial [Suillus decipiens]
ICINTCIGFTGPFSLLQHCPECDRPHYNQEVLHQTHSKVKTPHKQFVTVPVGPQLQALYYDLQSVQEMSYHNKHTQQIAEKLEPENRHKQSWSDFIDGTDYLEAIAAGKITNKDIVLMMSIDSARLYKSKASDCWMSIWVVFDHSPETRYKKKYILPGIIIPGPCKPKNLNSFLFPGFHHLTALQKEGLTVWDAMHDITFVSHPFLIL